MLELLLFGTLVGALTILDYLLIEEKITLIEFVFLLSPVLWVFYLIFRSNHWI